MVSLLHPSMHPDAELLRMQLFRTNTLFGSIAVKEFEKRSAMLNVLKAGCKVVIPDGTVDDQGPFGELIQALRLINYPVQEVSAYLHSITAPAGHCAAPTNQHSVPVGATTPVA